MLWVSSPYSWRPSCPPCIGKSQNHRGYVSSAHPYTQKVTATTNENIAQGKEILDRELRVVREVDPAERHVNRVAWADASHVLATLADLAGNRWSLVRYPLDGGEPETVAGPVRGGNPEIMSEYLPSE